MARLQLDEILNASDIPEAEVEIPEWGGSVKVRGLTKAKQEHLRKSAMIGGKIDEEKLQLLLIVHCVVDPVIEEGHIEQLRQKSAQAINRLALKIAELCGFTEGAHKEARKDFLSGDSAAE